MRAWSAMPGGFDAEGAFGEIVAGATLFQMDMGWNAFARDSMRLGDEGLRA